MRASYISTFVVDAWPHGLCARPRTERTGFAFNFTGNTFNFTVPLSYLGIGEGGGLPPSMD